MCDEALLDDPCNMGLSLPPTLVLSVPVHSERKLMLDDPKVCERFSWDTELFAKGFICIFAHV